MIDIDTNLTLAECDQWISCDKEVSYTTTESDSSSS